MSVKKTVWSEVYRLLGEHPEKFQNKSQISLDIGISSTDLYAFFSGNRLLRVTVLTQIAKYFKIELGEVTAEHLMNVKKYEKGRNK